MGDLRTTTIRSALVVALGVALLTGCAVQPSSGQLDLTSATDAPSGSAVAGPTTDAGGDSPPQYSLNKRHHERLEVAAASAAPLERARAQVDRDLAGLEPPVGQPAVERVLADAGAPDPWIVTWPADGTVQFEAQVAMDGCLVGRVHPDGTAEVTAAGWVLDGGCHALDGH